VRHLAWDVTEQCTGKRREGRIKKGMGGRKEAHSRREAKKAQSASGKMVALGICEGGQQSP
jgi:hypothetical protein